jgi:DamX protein
MNTHELEEPVLPAQPAVTVRDALDPPLAPRRAPFASGSDELFPQGPRKRLFDQLRHLSKWSRRALLITGPAATGKSTLFRHLRQALASNATVAAIDGNSCKDAAALYQTLAHQLGVDAGDHPESTALALLLREHLSTQQAAERLCAVLVDDAQLASTGALEALLSLSVDCRLRVLLFGDQTLPDRVTHATTDLDIACYESALLPLTEADARAYVEWRARQLGYPGSPFSEEQMASLYQASEGLPGRIDVLASEMLAQQPEQARAGFASQAKVFPIPHLWLTLGLLVVVGLLYAWIDGGPEPDAEVVAASMPQPLPDADPQTGAEPASLGPDDDAGGANALAPVVRGTQQTAVERAQTSAQPPVRTPPGLNPQLRLVPPTPKAVVAQPAAPEPAAPRQAPTVAAQPVPEPPTQAVAKAEPVAKAETKPAPAPAPAARNTVASDTGLVPGVRGSDWLLTRDGTHYTVQLITLASREGMAGYLEKQRRPSDFAVYRRNVDGKQLYVATFGSYPNRAAAEQASRRLPAAVGRVKPWIRELSAVQQTIRAQ